MNDYRITITLIADPEERPNAVGEWLRDAFFVQDEDDYGCYSTFDLRPNVTPLPNLEREDSDGYMATWTRASLITGCISNEHRWGNLSSMEIEMAYYWDGDGTLQFRFPDGSYLENDDCKKDHHWVYHRS